MAEISRRTLALGTAAAAAAAFFPGAVAAKPANVPVIWDGKKMWETFEKDGTGFSFPHKPGSPKAYVTFDTQCPDCIRFYDNIAPLLDNINLVWCPIAFLNIHSDPQGAAILIAKNPAEKFMEQHLHFRDAGFRGFRYDLAKIPEDVRNKVWTNTKLARRSGCRAVPFGVYKNPEGEYIALDENLKTEELKAIFGLK